MKHMNDIVITESNAEEIQAHNWMAEASELGLRPGQWPEQIATTLGNKQPFVMASRMWDGGELYAVDYRQANGCLNLRLYND